jgi:hypothetical protein
MESINDDPDNTLPLRHDIEVPSTTRCRRVSARLRSPAVSPHSTLRSSGDMAFALLLAKARVCDAYRAWLQNPRRNERLVIARELLELNRLEARGARP